MANENLPVLPKGWRKMKEYENYKEVTPTPKNTNNFIPAEDVEIGAVYRTHVKDIVKVLNNNNGKFKLYNISGAHHLWVDFKNIAFVEKL